MPLRLSSILYIMYTMTTSYLSDMEDITMSIVDLRKDLSGRIEAAHFRNEPTIIRNAKRGEPRAALIPYAWLQELYDLRAARDAGNA